MAVVALKRVFLLALTSIEYGLSQLFLGIDGVNPRFVKAVASKSCVAAPLRSTVPCPTGKSSEEDTN